MVSGRWSTVWLTEDADRPTPGSEALIGGPTLIRELVAHPDGDMVHATVPPGTTSAGGHNQGRTQIYYVVSGNGWMWLDAEGGQTIRLRPGASVLVPRDVDFQYRTPPAPKGTGLELLAVSMPTFDPAAQRDAARRAWSASSPEPTVDSRGSANVVDLALVPDYTAPDGSAIHLLPDGPEGGLSYCALSSGALSSPTTHRTVSEIWFVVGGHGAMWRIPFDPATGSTAGSGEETVLRPGMCVDIPLGTVFQFVSTGARSLEVLIFTFPKWPGPDEAIAVPSARRWG